MLGRFIQDLAIYLPSKMLPALTALITVPILTHLLTPLEFGSYALAVGVYEFLFALTCSGLGAAAVRFYPAYHVKDQLGAFFAALGGLLLLAVAAGCLGALVLLTWLGASLPDDLLPLLYISVLIFAVQAPHAVLMQVARAQERSRLYTSFDLLTNYSGLALGLLLLAIFGWGVPGLLWGVFVAFALTLTALAPLVIRGRARGAWQLANGDVAGLWRYAWPLALGNMAMWGLRLSDRYLIGAFRSRVEVGVYSAVYNISSKSIDILVAVFLLSLGPLVINTFERLGRRATQQAMYSTTRVFLIVCLPAVVGLTALAGPFVAALTDAPYHAGSQVVGFVVLSSFAYGLSQIASVGLLLAKRTGRIAANQILAVLVNLGLNFILIPRYGFVAAGITTLIGYLTLVVLQALAARPHLAWPFPYRTLRNTALASVAAGVTAIAVYAVSGNADGVHFGFLLLAVAAAIAAYGLCLVLLGELDPHERAAIRQHLGRVAQKLVAPLS
jgi:O-antigen/teichoic acid export membrane protein